MTKIIKSEQYKEYYFYKQKGFNAKERKEIPLKFKPFDIIRHYEPLNFSLPTVTDEQVSEYKQHIIDEAKKKNFALKYTDEDYYYLTQCNEIKKKAEYFLIGKFDKVDGEISTFKNGFVYKYLAVLDYEYLAINTEEFYELIHSKLSKYSYMIYKSVSYTEVHPRFRVIVDTSREMNEGENLATLKSIVELIGIEPDPLSFTYSQIQGLPLIINGGDYKPIVNHGEPYPVQEAVKQENKIKSNYTASNVQNNNILVSDEAFKSMFERYLVIDYENIKPGAPNEYNRILTILLALSRDVCYKVISYDIACECSDLLANIGATPDKYKEGNLKKINHAINSWKNNPNYFESEKSYSMLDKFKIVGDEELKNEVNKYFSFNNSSTISLGNNSNLYVKNLSDNSILEIETNKEGKVIQTLENLEKMILSITPIAYNELKEIIEVTESNGKVKQLADRHKELLRSAIEKKYKIKVNAIDLKTALVGASERYKYHPIKSKILSTEWDGIPRAERFFVNVFGVEDNLYNLECTRKWFLAGVYRAFEPGTKFDEMLIIHGEQGLGKSTTFRKLSLDCHLEPTEEIKEELMRKALRSWIVELSELATMKKTDSDTFKAWLSTPVDCVKKLYDRDPQDYPRSFIVCGTTNEKEILKDRTGNRRYWLMYGELERRTLDIKNVDEEYILQLWSEVYQWYKNKETLLISDETKLYMKKLSSGALEHNPLEERINSILEMKVPNNWHDFIIDSGSRFNYYNHVNDYVSFGKSDSRFPQETQITDITTGELLYLLSDNSPSFHTDMRGNKLAKDINKVMNNLPNWKKSESIKRSYNKRGLKGFVRKLK